MTADNTGAADIIFSVTNGDAPTAKSVYLAGDQSGLTCGMGIVADLAGTAFVGFVDVNEVKVEHAVPEVGFLAGSLIIRQPGGVAAEAECKIALIERSIKIFRKVLFQQVRELCPMRGVTRGAFSGSNGSMHRFAAEHGFIVTLHTEV